MTVSWTSKLGLKYCGCCCKVDRGYVIYSCDYHVNFWKYQDLYLFDRMTTWDIFLLYVDTNILYLYSQPACSKPLIIQYNLCAISSMTAINQQAWIGLMINVLMSTLIFSMSSWGVVTQQTRDVDPVLACYWASVEDSGPAFHHNWINALCSLGTDSCCWESCKVIYHVFF